MFDIDSFISKCCESSQEKNVKIIDLYGVCKEMFPDVTPAILGKALKVKGYQIIIREGYKWVKGFVLKPSLKPTRS